MSEKIERELYRLRLLYRLFLVLFVDCIGVSYDM